jgi:hypothetical protein
VTLHSGVRYQAKIEEKQPKMPQNRLKIVSQPSKSLEHHFEPPQNNFLSSKTHRRPQAGREILARHVNILPTFRRKSPNSQHQHFGRAVSTDWESLTVFIPDRAPGSPADRDTLPLTPDRGPDRTSLVTLTDSDSDTRCHTVTDEGVPHKAEQFYAVR